ncbi:hypothetical protein D9758_010841 [Tetrapyrgos nigripes]|uniref:Uncharacterized protein n=1 Tax=Tetrapyrgos nigripes TaxID=182062 RepID=A0A8H5LQ91_9AGAR|nr:hypothetical protein D9758_010841 [Tetrapyrgos nigripes]
MVEKENRSKRKKVYPDVENAEASISNQWRHLKEKRPFKEAGRLGNGHWLRGSSKRFVSPLAAQTLKMDTVLDSAIAPSRFEELLKSNERPLDSEVAFLVAQLRAALSRLANSGRERPDLKGMIAQYKLILAPMRRVPNDVLAEIFSVVKRVEYEDRYESWLWEATYMHPFEDIANVQQTPWTLSHPYLFQSLGLLVQNGGATSPPSAREIERRLSRHYSRTALHQCLSAPSSFLTSPATSLLNLLPFPWMSKAFFSSAPALRQVKLSAMANPHILGIRWSQLDRLYLERIPSWRNTFAILRQLTQAVEVNLYMMAEEEEEEDGETALIVWPHVQTLTLQFLEPGDAARLFGLRNTPSMRTLNMVDMEHLFPDYSSFTSFLRRSVPPLQQLTISFVNNGFSIDRGFSDVLRHIPSLLELHLHSITCITDDFLQSLVYYSRNSSSVLVPHLTTLELEWLGDFLPLNLALMTDVIESRRGIFTDGQTSSHIRRLQKVRIDLEYFKGSDKDVAIRTMKFETFKSSLVSFCAQHHLNIELDLSWHGSISVSDS